MMFLVIPLFLVITFFESSFNCYLTTTVRWFIKSLKKIKVSLISTKEQSTELHYFFEEVSGLFGLFNL